MAAKVNAPRCSSRLFIALVPVGCRRTPPSDKSAQSDLAELSSLGVHPHHPSEQIGAIAVKRPGIGAPPDMLDLRDV